MNSSDTDQRAVFAYNSVTQLRISIECSLNDRHDNEQDMSELFQYFSLENLTNSSWSALTVE